MSAGNLSRYGTWIESAGRHLALYGAVLMLLLAPLAPLPGLVGAACAVTTFAVTSTFLITGPGWETSLGGFPALSPFGGFVIKDLALLGIAVSTLGRAIRGTRA